LKERPSWPTCRRPRRSGLARRRSRDGSDNREADGHAVAGPARRATPGRRKATDATLDGPKEIGPSTSDGERVSSWTRRRKRGNPAIDARTGVITTWRGRGARRRTARRRRKGHRRDARPLAPHGVASPRRRALTSRHEQPPGIRKVKLRSPAGASRFTFGRGSIRRRKASASRTTTATMSSVAFLRGEDDLRRGGSPRNSGVHAETLGGRARSGSSARAVCAEISSCAPLNKRAVLRNWDLLPSAKAACAGRGFAAGPAVGMGGASSVAAAGAGGGSGRRLDGRRGGAADARMCGRRDRRFDSALRRPAATSISLPSSRFTARSSSRRPAASAR